jgi:hypothetical protein
MLGLINTTNKSITVFSSLNYFVAPNNVISLWSFFANEFANKFSVNLLLQCSGKKRKVYGFSVLSSELPLLFVAQLPVFPTGLHVHPVTVAKCTPGGWALVRCLDIPLPLARGS